MGAVVNKVLSVSTFMLYFMEMLVSAILLSSAVVCLVRFLNIPLLPVRLCAQYSASVLLLWVHIFLCLSQTHIMFEIARYDGSVLMGSGVMYIWFFCGLDFWSLI